MPSSSFFARPCGQWCALCRCLVSPDPIRFKPTDRWPRLVKARRCKRRPLRGFAGSNPARFIQMLQVGMERRCSTCKEIRDLDQFPTELKKKFGKSYTCRLCARKAHRKHELKKYGLTIESYEELLTKQEGRCAVCRHEVEGLLHVDHDHETGRVRGLLCRECNRGIGLLGDSLEILESAVQYLRGMR